MPVNVWGGGDLSTCSVCVWNNFYNFCHSSQKMFPTPPLPFSNFSCLSIFEVHKRQHKEFKSCSSCPGSTQDAQTFPTRWLQNAELPDVRHTTQAVWYGSPWVSNNCSATLTTITEQYAWVVRNRQVQVQIPTCAIGFCTFKEPIAVKISCQDLSTFHHVTNRLAGRAAWPCRSWYFFDSFSYKKTLNEYNKEFFKKYRQYRNSVAHLAALKPSLDHKQNFSQSQLL